ncbi:hypothetical protein DFS34DRAFT_1839 [Phlyctochytrium arcticum]|nr:hypothetical protein DFS34DRAFT_1839 [Phlyctochytrium arcticum]
MAPVPEEQAVDHFSALPEELAVTIASYLLAPDIAQLCRANKFCNAVCRDEYLWHVLTLRRFGVDPHKAEYERVVREPDGADPGEKKLVDGRRGGEQPVDVYKRLAKNGLRLAPEDMGIIWLDGSHWSLEEEPGSTHGRVARLATVCWYDMRGRVRGVPRGWYLPIWRVKIGPSYARYIGGQTEEDIEHNATVADRDGTSIKEHDSTTSSRKFGSFASTNTPRGSEPQYRDFVLPPLNVGMWPGGPPFLDVDVEAVEHSDTWKSRIVYDGFRLERVTEQWVRERQERVKSGQASEDIPSDWSNPNHPTSGDQARSPNEEQGNNHPDDAEDDGFLLTLRDLFHNGALLVSDFFATDDNNQWVMGDHPTQPEPVDPGPPSQFLTSRSPRQNQDQIHMPGAFAPGILALDPGLMRPNTIPASPAPASQQNQDSSSDPHPAPDASSS